MIERLTFSGNIFSNQDKFTTKILNYESKSVVQAFEESEIGIISSTKKVVEWFNETGNDSDNFFVKVIGNTGDEIEFGGHAFELIEEFLDGMSANNHFDAASFHRACLGFEEMLSNIESSFFNP